MKKITFMINLSAWALDLSDLARIMVQPQEVVSEEIYLATLNESITICLS